MLRKKQSVFLMAKQSDISPCLYAFEFNFLVKNLTLTHAITNQDGVLHTNFSTKHSFVKKVELYIQNIQIFF